MRLVSRFGALLALLFLSGCWLPNNFEAEVRVSKFGSWSLNFVGTLIYAPVYEDFKSGKLKGAALEQKMKVLERDLRRDSGFKEIKAVGPAQFRVRFEKLDRITGSMRYAFLRKNAEVLGLRVTPDGSVVVHGTPLTPEMAKRVAGAGFTVNGTLKVVTDVERVSEHNATAEEVIGIAKVFTWKITSPTQPMPKIVLDMW